MKRIILTPEVKSKIEALGSKGVPDVDIVKQLNLKHSTVSKVVTEYWERKKDKMDKVTINIDELPKDSSVEEALALMRRGGVIMVNSKRKANLVVSFDFDNTLSEKPMQDLCTKYLQLGAEVHVTTARRSGMKGGIEFENKDLFEVTDKLGIKREHITFTNYDNKVNYVKDCDMHYDDDHVEIYHINEHPSKCMGFLFEGYQNTDNGIAPNY